MTHPIRFGIQLANPIPGTDWAETARQVEAAGFSSVLMPDHFGDQLAPMVALTAAAAATTQLRVGALVFANDYKHPVVLAKELATLDVLSGGRVEWGIGAGWMRTDYEQSGITLDRPGVRIARLAESVEVMRGAFGEGVVDHEGEHYTVRGYDGLPKPVQAGGPPLLIGGGGPKMLAYAARNADIVGINPNMAVGEIGPEVIADASAEATDRKIGWVRGAAGDRFDAIELNTMCITTVTDDRTGTVDGMAAMFGVTPDVIADAPMMLIGSTDEMANTLLERRDRFGFSYFVISNLTDLASIEPLVSGLTGR